ncbi:hypothetical protein SEA_MAGRITTE_235 [Microbacterium phage Magritte]|nr:hypothetical protein SEA_MAGRITTE_235 [Microbacterium phage Magritte]
MKTELPDIEIPGPEGWDIQEEKRTSPTNRHFKATPKEPLIVDYVTWERFRGRLIEIVVPAQIVDVNVSHFWHEEKQAWSDHPNIRYQLLNPRTEKPYSVRNPMHGIRNVRFRDFEDFEEMPTSRNQIERVIVEATRPQTKIIVTITEEPLNA